MPLIPKPDTRESSPTIPAQRSHRLQCIAVVDKGMVETEYKGKKNTNHKVMLVHESYQTIDKPGSDYHGKPYLLFSTVNFYYGRKDAGNKKKPAIVKIIEAHLRRDMTDDERFHPDHMYDIEKLIGHTVVGYAELQNNGWARISSWQFDISDEGDPRPPWEQRSEWKPREVDSGDDEDATSFNFGENKENEEEEKFFS